MGSYMNTHSAKCRTIISYESKFFKWTKIHLIIFYSKVFTPFLNVIVLISCICDCNVAERSQEHSGHLWACSYF